MRKPWTEGDPVVVYSTFDGEAARYTGIVTKVIPPRLHVKLAPPRDNFLSIWAHEKQCRRLTKKKRVRVWVGLRIVCAGDASWELMEALSGKPDFKTADGKPWREFVEVRRA